MTMYERQPSAPRDDRALHHQGAPAGALGTAGTGGGRPAGLSRAVGAAIAAACLNVIGAIGILLAGTQVVKDQIAMTTTAEDGSAVPADMVDASGERAEGLLAIYTGLASSTIFWSLVLIVVAWLALRGGRATRIISVVILIISTLMKAMDLFIAMPTITVIADVFVVIVALAAIVLFFRPAR